MATTLNMTLLLRRAAFADSCVLQEGEPGYNTSTKEFKIGDGSTTWANLKVANEVQIRTWISELETTLEGKITANTNKFNDYYTESEVNDLLSALKSSLEGQISAEATARANKDTELENAIKTKLAEDTFNTWKGTHETDHAPSATQIASDIESAVNGEKSARETAINGINAKIGSVPEGKTVFELISDAVSYAESYASEEAEAAYVDAVAEAESKDAARAQQAQTAINNAVSYLETKITETADAVKEYTDGEITKVESRLTTAETDIDTLQEQIKGLSGAMHFKGIYDELPGAKLEPIKDGYMVLDGADIVIDTSITPTLDTNFKFGAKESYYYNVHMNQFTSESEEFYISYPNLDLILYVSEGASDEQLAQLGVSQRGWQVDRFRYGYGDEPGDPNDFDSWREMSVSGCPYFLAEQRPAPANYGTVIKPGDTIYFDTDAVSAFVEEFLADNPEPDRTHENGDKEYILATLADADESHTKELILYTRSDNTFRVYLPIYDGTILDTSDGTVNDSVEYLYEPETVTVSDRLWNFNFMYVNDKPASAEEFVSGDVIAVGDKEYVYNGSAFVEFGDISAEGERLTELESKVGSKTVAEQITEAKEYVADNYAEAEHKHVVADITDFDSAIKAYNYLVYDDLSATVDELYGLVADRYNKDDSDARYVAKEGYVEFTQDEKTKLAGLSNYDESALANRVKAIEDAPYTTKAYVDAQDSATLADAKAYTDQIHEVAVGQAVAQAQGTPDDTSSAATISGAKKYAEEKAAAALADAKAYADGKEHKNTTYTVAATESPLGFTLTPSEGIPQTITLVAPTVDVGVTKIKQGTDIVVDPTSGTGEVTVSHKAYGTGTYTKPDSVSDANFVTGINVENGHVTGASVKSLADALAAMEFILDGGTSAN